MTNTIKIKTRLRHRNEIFKLFWVSQETRLPILLLGEAGTGKTQSFLDFAKSINGGKTFIKQMNFDTRWEDLIGYLSLPKLKNGEIERINGIQDATYILLDEIDKTSTSVRNLVLSILRERQIFDGGNLVDCNWKLLVGTSNREEFDEEDKPFLDRFVLKYKLERVGVSRVQDLLETTDEREISFSIVDLDSNKYERAIKSIEKILPDIYDEMSDRTISYIPALIGAFMRVNNNDINRSIMNVLGYTIGIAKANSLVEKLGVAKEVTKAKELAEAYKKAVDDSSRAVIVGQLVELRKQVRINTAISREDVAEIEKIANEVMNS